MQLNMQLYCGKYISHAHEEKRRIIDNREKHGLTKCLNNITLHHNYSICIHA